ADPRLGRGDLLGRRRSEAEPALPHDLLVRLAGLGAPDPLFAPPGQPRLPIHVDTMAAGYDNFPCAQQDSAPGGASPVGRRRRLRRRAGGSTAPTAAA